MNVVACLSLSHSCGFGLTRGLSLIKLPRSLKSNWVIMAFLQLGKLGPMSLGMLVLIGSSPILSFERGAEGVS